MRARPPGESAAGLRGSAGHREVQLIWGGQDQPTLPATIHPTVHAAGGPARPALLQWPCTRRRCACRCCGAWEAVRRALRGVGGCAQSDEQKPGGRRAASAERGHLCPRHPALSSCGRHPQQHCLEESRELGRTAGHRRHSGRSWPPLASARQSDGCWTKGREEPGPGGHAREADGLPLWPVTRATSIQEDFGAIRASLPASEGAVLSEGPPLRESSKWPAKPPGRSPADAKSCSLGIPRTPCHPRRTWRRPHLKLRACGSVTCSGVG